jgi:hypothetical protein
MMKARNSRLVSRLEILFGNVDLTAETVRSCRQTGMGLGRALMSEFGAIFDYQSSAAVFCWISFGFLAVYGLAAMWGSQESDSLAAQPA